MEKTKSTRKSKIMLFSEFFIAMFLAFLIVTIIFSKVALAVISVIGLGCSCYGWYTGFKKSEQKK